MLPPVRRVAARDLVQVAQEGDRQACDALITRLQEDRTQGVRQAAAQGLGQVAQ